MAASRRHPLKFPLSQSTLLDSYLPTPSDSQLIRPFITLTYATSLDASVSLAPGVQTFLSGPESKAMTHFLRSKHDAILIGVGTAIADEPSLNCRIEGVGGYGKEGLEGQPRPVVLDPWGRWEIHVRSKVVTLAQEGRGKGPWIMSLQEPSVTKKRTVEDVGGRYIVMKQSTTTTEGKLDWDDIFIQLKREGISSVMIEGGGSIINDLLSPPHLLMMDSVIVTIAPVWLGTGGVLVCPEEQIDAQGRKVPVGRLQNVQWIPLGQDIVLCGRPFQSIDT